MHKDLDVAFEQARQLPDNEQEKLAEQLGPAIEHVRKGGSSEGFSAASELLPAVVKKLKG